jgi:hypothetical protein
MNRHGNGASTHLPPAGPPRRLPLPRRPRCPRLLRGSRQEQRPGGRLHLDCSRQIGVPWPCSLPSNRRLHPRRGHIDVPGFGLQESAARISATSSNVDTVGVGATDDNLHLAYCCDVAAQATDPSGKRWRVGIRWLPWPLRFRGDARLDPAAVDWLPFELSAGGGVTLLAIVVGVILLLTVALPVVIFAVEVVVLVVLAVAGLVGRVILRRPWTIVARSDRDEVRQWRVTGWGAAQAAVDDIARSIGAGIEPGIPRS